MVLINTRYVDGLGFVQEKYVFDEHRTDFELRLRNGEVLKQLASFSYFKNDWDDGRYELFVAPFKNRCGEIRWYCPSELLSIVLEEKITVNGIERV